MDTYDVKSITISKKPGGSEDKYRIAFIGLFNENNPHLTAQAPFKVLEINDIEKVRLHDLRNVSFYLVGNDIVINNLEKLHVDISEGVVTLSGKQVLP
ncbi:hypothetical protein COV12_01750 [Candidatus Woesearchaeota archaeon CG10_big_fil_rev_8_21_14_0_10_32_24]|nr:MAG: hypothetical protein COV12_01750 [Candidatus Woesearchaeota archaeon CG10_big_fil_rev_8_21_14_0_10_32_24]